MEQLSAIEKRAIVFVSLMFFTLTILFTQRARYEHLFGIGKRVKIITDRGYGIAVGTIVKIQDLEAGQVEEVRLNEKNQVVSLIRITRAFQDRVRDDSKAIVTAPPFIGGTVISITPGDPQRPEVKNYAVLKTEVPEDVMTQLAKISGNLTQATQKVNTILDQVSGTMGNVQSITSTISRGQGTVGSLIMSNQLYAQISTMVQQVSQLIGAISPAAENLVRATKDVPGITQNVKDTTDSVASILDKVNKGKGNIGKIVNDESMYQTASDIMNSTNSILNKVTNIQASGGFESSYFMDRNVLVAKPYLKVSPTPSTYFLFGGAFFNPAGNNQTTKTEVLLGKKFAGNAVTVKAGLLEGATGGGLDVQMTQKVKLQIEGRDVHKGTAFDKSMKGFLLRSKVSMSLFEPLNIGVGLNDLLNNPELLFGVTYQSVPQKKKPLKKPKETETIIIKKEENKKEENKK